MSATLLVLQHIACEPPAAFEEELLERGLDLARVELDEGEAIPDRDDFAGAPPTVPTLQWHGDTFDLPEGATLLARSPAYRNGALDRLVAEVAANSDSTLPLARRLFGRWLERVVRVPAHSFG
jgi:hypothetical protein